MTAPSSALDRDGRAPAVRVGGLGRVLSIAKVGLPNWFRRREQIGQVPLESGLCRVV
ncbi:hypothetical protein AB7783_28645 [Tardiphaga sp. 172_B4_N1_3]|uniref:hypothetical protein n=1 Tax=Tardiphaga sp. 172_B4_N1_3 TaxID=3240787 RepID=UPI003F8B2B33